MSLLNRKLRDTRAIATLALLLTAAVAVPGLGLGSRLNQLFLLGASGLFVGTLVVAPKREHDAFYRFSLRLLSVSFGLNLVYEAAQSGLYLHPGQSFTFWQAAALLVSSALADAAITWFLFLATTLTRPGRWFWRAPSASGATAIVAVLGLAVQAIGETAALRAGRWAYGGSMPLVPWLQVGLTPLLQMALLAPFSLWLARMSDRLSAANDLRQQG